MGRVVVLVVVLATIVSSSITLSFLGTSVAVAAPPSEGLFAGGVVSGYGDAATYGSFGGIVLASPAVAMAATPTGDGYWLTAIDGGVFAFGDANFYGSTGGVRLNQPIVGMAATPDGKGYWLVATDGGIFAFGDAGFYGSTGSIQLNEPIVGMAATPDGKGYWLVAADGGIFAFGDAGFYGSAANQNIGTSVTGIAATPDGKGYWLVAATAGVLSYGDAQFLGPSPNNPPFSPTAAIVATPDGKGYWLLQPDDVATAFTDPSAGAGADIVDTAASQVGQDPDANQGTFCNPYGPCEEWCALFATWVWNQQGIDVPRYPFTGNVYVWGVDRGLALGPNVVPAAGDAVLFGTGPRSTATSTHMGIVGQVWPDGAIVSIEGDAGPEPYGKYAVIVNGPYLPSDSAQYNGEPIYGYVQP
jgi:hypothetical protein